MYNWIVEEPDDTYRNVAAMTVGLSTAVFGGWVPLLGIVLGVPAQALKLPQRNGVEHMIDGIVDGSAALLSYNLVTRSAPVAAMVRPYAMGYQDKPRFELQYG